jgi:hypothetical protein
MTSVRTAATCRGQRQWQEIVGTKCDRPATALEFPKAARLTEDQRIDRADCRGRR